MIDIRLHAKSRQGNDWRRRKRRKCANTTNQLIAIDIGHLYVGNDQVRQLAFGDLQSGSSLPAGQDGISSVLELPLHHEENIRNVVDEQKLHRPPRGLWELGRDLPAGMLR